MERSVLSGSAILPGTTQLPKLAFSVSRRQCRKLAIPRVSAEKESSTESSNGKDRIYIGKGKYIMDDAKKYPNKENAGELLQGISGGWAGGEIGLKAFTAEFAEERPSTKSSTNSSSSKKTAGGVPTKFAGKDVVAEKMGEGEDTLYVGFSARSTEDLMARREGAMGKFIVDDAKKYPSKDNYAGIGDLAGGFAGGEKGLKQFVEKGDIEFIDPSQRRRQWSPVVVATVVAGVGSAGAILLNNVFDFSEGIINQDVLNTAMDDRTKLLFEVAIGLLAVTWIGSTAFATFKALRENLSLGNKSATNILITVGFWTLVLVAAYRISQT